jgi:glucose/arabinose dehydrogenase
MNRSLLASLVAWQAVTACDSRQADTAPVQAERVPPTRRAPRSPSAFAREVAGDPTAGANKPSPPPAAVRDAVTLRRVLHGLSQPVLVTSAPHDGRLFVVEKTGTVRIARDGTVASRPFLDVTRLVSSGSEQGLLGLAFHPRFAENRRLFVHYTDRDGDTRVVEYRVRGDDPDTVDPTSARVVLAVDQPYANHNGGDLVFGPDGKLWIGLGDGGSAGDPQRNGQDRSSRLGKMLRLDVDAARPAPEIAGIGLRNPWRYAFDARTGDLYIGDVGQDRWESIYAVPADRVMGQNFGWSVAEGAHCFRREGCDRSAFVTPVVDYPHGEGCSVTGGVVYRGKALPALDGAYFYADYCTGLLRSFRWSRRTGVRDHWDWRAALDPERKLNSVSSFGVDADGEVYVVSIVGDVYLLARR